MYCDQSRASRREQAVDSALRLIHRSLPRGNERLECVLMQNGQLGVCGAYPDLPVSPSAFNFNFIAAILGFAVCHCGPIMPPFPFRRSKRELGAVGSVAAFSKLLLRC